MVEIGEEQDRLIRPDDGKAVQRPFPQVEGLDERRAQRGAFLRADIPHRDVDDLRPVPDGHGLILPQLKMDIQ